MARVEEVKTSDGESGRSEPLSGPPPWPSPPLPPGPPPTASGRSPRPPLKLSARREAPSERRLVGRPIVKIATRPVCVVARLSYLRALAVVLGAGIVLR